MINVTDDISNKLSKRERETHITLYADDRSIVDIHTDDPVMHRRLVKKGHKPSVNYGTHSEFHIDSRWLTFRTYKED